MVYMASITDLICFTPLATKYIDDIYANNKLLTKKNVSEIIRKIIESYDVESSDKKIIMHSIITKITERHNIEDKLVLQIINLFIEIDDTWLHNLCKNGYKIKWQVASRLGIKKYLEFIKYDENAGQIGENLAATVLTIQNLQEAATIIEKEQICFTNNDRKRWGSAMATIISKLYYYGNVSPFFANLFFCKSNEYASFIMSNYMTHEYVDYKQLIANGTISSYIDAILCMRDKCVSYKEKIIKNIINNLIQNNILPELNFINKAINIDVCAYETYKEIIEKFIKDKIIKKTSDCNAFYMCKINKKYMENLFILFAQNNVEIDKKFLKIICDYSSIDTPDYTNTEYYKILQIALTLLSKEEKDLSDVILHACVMCDEILFDILYNLMIKNLENNNPNDSTIIINLDVNHALKQVINSINEYGYGINIAKTLLNAKAIPLLEYISETKDEKVVKLLINYGLEIDSRLLELTIKNGIELKLDEYFDNKQYDSNILYKLCAKYNFFPTEYCNIIGKRAKVHLEIQKSIKRCDTFSKIKKMIEENDICPSQDMYTMANIIGNNELVEYFETKYGMFPDLMTLVNIQSGKMEYIKKFAKFHNLEKLIKTKCNDI